MLATLLVSLGAMLLLTVPIAVSLAICTVSVFIFFFNNTTMDTMLAQAMVTSSDSFPMMAIPFFMLVGSLMERAKIARQLVKVAEIFTGDMHGGLGMTTIVAATFFAAICGSGPATAAAIGGIMMPALLRHGYSREYSGGLIACSSVIGPIIPPSIPMIMFGVTVGASITTMFIAGIVPGIIFGGICMGYNYFVSKKRNYRGVSSTMSRAEKWTVIKHASPALVMPIIVLGGIYTGIFTPTESAVVGVMWACLIGSFYYKNLTFAIFKDALVEAAVTSATVMFILGGAITFGRLMTIGKIPQTLTATMTSFTDSPLVIMLFVNLVLLGAGMLVDTISCVIIFAPLFTPVLTGLGYHPVFFGVIMVINLCIGMVTPPTGINTMVAQRVAGTSFEAVVKEAAPLVLLLIAALVVMIMFPSIILFVPEALGML